MQTFPNVLEDGKAESLEKQKVKASQNLNGNLENAHSETLLTQDRAFSEQYLGINREAHQRPAPAFGAPTLIRHIGLWPYPEADPANVSGTGSYEETVTQFSKRREKFFGAINAVLMALQEHGRCSGERSLFTLEFPGGGLSGRKNTRFKVTKRDSVSFTLWWPDQKTSRSDSQGSPRSAVPGAVRVRVHAEAYIDHATITLFIDPGKPWNNERAIFQSEHAIGTRQRRIFEDAEAIKSICSERMRPDIIDVDLIPENDVSEEQAERLLKARNFLYDGIWDAFCEDFGLDLNHLTEQDGRKVGEVFALFHGLVLSTSGYSSPKTTSPIEEAAVSATPGVRPFRRFDSAGVEPNAVVKAFWPFIRRMTPYADYRELIACGVLDWRALYITSLGAASTFAPGDEGEDRLKDAPSGNLPEFMDGYDPERPFPVRYLLLSKGEPHRRQIGRIVERINALGTMRLFVFKDWPVIRQASEHVRLRGLHLDRVMTRWHLKRKYLETAFDRRELALKTVRRAETYEDVLAAIDDKIDAQRSAAPGASPSRPAPEEEHIVDQTFNKLELSRMNTLDKLMDKKSEVYAELARTIENDLVEIGTALGEIGELCPGGIHYTINRANYYIKEFNLMRDRLQAGNIESWVSYDQFVDRGLKPSFDFIQSTGDRLASLRNRLQIVTQSIQTSAVFVQASETRRNTQLLKDIAEHWRTTNFLLGLWGIVVVLYNSIVSVLPDSPYRWALFGGAILLTVIILMTNRSVRRLIRHLKEELTWWDVAESGASKASPG